jgi:hypothetical protein
MGKGKKGRINKINWRKGAISLYYWSILLLGSLFDFFISLKSRFTKPLRSLAGAAYSGAVHYGEIHA